MFETVGVIGAGLLGASLGLAVKQRRLAQRVIGFAPSDYAPGIADLEAARRRDAFDNVHVGLDAKLGAVDFLVACTPVDRIADHLSMALRFLPAGAAVTDVGSAKVNIVNALKDGSPVASRFVGSHPMAGSERRGPDAASAQLFAGRTCLVTPDESTASEVLERATRFWTQLGMTVVACSPQLHDAVVARTSHLPHLVAAALASQVGAADRPFVGAGFRDTTRIAGGDAVLWAAILKHNREPVHAALRTLIKKLHEVDAAVQRGDEDLLRQWLEDAKRERDALGY